jgi:hypothetical protein
LSAISARRRFKTSITTGSSETCRARCSWVFKKCVVCGDDTEVLAHVTIDGETYDLPICGGYDPSCSQKLMGHKPKTLIRLYRKTHFRVGYKA